MNGKSFRTLASAVSALWNSGYTLQKDTQKRFVWVHPNEDVVLRARVSPHYPCRTVIWADGAARVVRQEPAPMPVAA